MSDVLSRTKFAKFNIKPRYSQARYPKVQQLNVGKRNAYVPQTVVSTRALENLAPKALVEETAPHIRRHGQPVDPIAAAAR